MEIVRITQRVDKALPLARQEDYQKLCKDAKVVFEYMAGGKPSYFIKSCDQWFFWTA